jgi:hypothetical protein
MRDGEVTAEEASFCADLCNRVPGLDDWYHVDSDGTPWMIISYDFVVDNVVRDTLRLDYDGSTLRGGWSPAFLNWDDGVRAEAAGINTDPPDGLCIRDLTGHDTTSIAAAWFAEHITRWPSSARAADG